MAKSGASITEPPPIERYGRYEIVHKLASGGMGEVFLARAQGAAGFQKFVVIKKILPHLLKDPRFVEGLVREAKLLVNLQHPNIVQVVDLGVEGDDYFMAMEYVHGHNMATITHYCATTQEVIPADACVYIVTQVLAALQYAHERKGPGGARQNIVHRDVSPQNVLIADDGQVRLTDFGIAKVLSEADHGYTNSLKGKYRYMAPEAVDGGLVDHRYDLFATGILLFEGLCRRHLFAARRNEDILVQIRAAKMPDVEQYHPGVSPEVVRVLTHALAKDPDERYQSAREFADALRAAIHPVTEAQAGQSLKAFIEDLYAKGDFPINKPKLSDLREAQSAKTQTILKSTRLTNPELPKETTGKQRKNDIWLWLGALIILGIGMGVLFYALTDDGSAGRAVSTVDARAAPTIAPDTKPLRDALALPKDSKGETTGTVGGFQVNEAAKIFRRRGGALRNCFHRYLRAGDGVKIQIVSTVDGRGRVSKVRVDTTTVIPDGLRKCLIGVADKLRYAPHDKPSVEFSIPLNAQIAR